MAISHSILNKTTNGCKFGITKLFWRCYIPVSGVITSLKKFDFVEQVASSDCSSRCQGLQMAAKRYVFT